MKYVYLTIDMEEWYELDYLKKYNLDKTVEVIPEIIDFLDLLDELKIKAVFFFLANMIERNAGIVRDIVKRGHAIGCHGFNHDLLYEKDIQQFITEIKQAKNTIEKVTKCDVTGYRAACFSIERDKLDVLSEIGFLYDSSYIKFEQHPLYRNLDIEGFEKLDDLSYRKNDFYEFEIPTLKIAKYNLPISGGGYMRLFPFWVLRIFIKMYAKQHHNFLIYLHPFELTKIKLPLTKDICWKEQFRLSIGRKNNFKKIKKVIILLKSMGAEFCTFEQVMKE